MSDANERSCATMDAMVQVAKSWDLASDDGPPCELVDWVALRMQAYADGGWEGERAVMIEWISWDLEMDEGDAATLCEAAGWSS